MVRVKASVVINNKLSVNFADGHETAHHGDMVFQTMVSAQSGGIAEGAWHPGEENSAPKGVLAGCFVKLQRDGHRRVLYQVFKVFMTPRMITVATSGLGCT